MGEGTKKALFRGSENLIHFNYAEIEIRTLAIQQGREMKAQFKNIGNLVKESRTKLDPAVSQQDLSSLLGYKNGQFVSNIERGLCAIPAKHISSLSAIIKVPPSEIINAMVEDYKLSLLGAKQADLKVKKR